MGLGLFLAKSDSVAYRAGMLAIDGCFATASRETEGGDVDALPPSLFEWLYYCILKRDCPRRYSVLTRRIYKFLNHSYGTGFTFPGTYNGCRGEPDFVTPRQCGSRPSSLITCLDRFFMSLLAPHATRIISACRDCS